MLSSSDLLNDEQLNISPMYFTLQPISASTLQGASESIYLSGPLPVSAEDASASVVTADTGRSVGIFEGKEVVGFGLGAELREREGGELFMTVGSKVVGFDVLGAADGAVEASTDGDKLLVTVGSEVGGEVTGARVGVADGLTETMTDGLELLANVGKSVGSEVTGEAVGVEDGLELLVMVGDGVGVFDDSGVTEATVCAAH